MGNLKKIIVLFILFSSALLCAQKNSAFEKYARSEDSICRQAYEKRDIKTFESHLKAFLVKYNKLSVGDKKTFSSTLNGLYYNLACTYSLLGDKPRALDNLEKSIQAGFLDYAHIQGDSDLVNIRSENTFKTLLAPLRQYGDYLYILKKAGAYNDHEINNPLPAFTYQASGNANLQTLRTSFHLDSIAGEASDVVKILNLMHWMHRLIPHDGSHANPAVKNALNMITLCKKENRGLNCRGLATVLNECYLALGIKSRFVTCLPKDSLGVDNDCHVINMVYSTSLKKWLWIDPTFDAYVMNENGEMLGIEEVRERIIEDRPLILNPEANWNEKSTQTKEDYLLNYMAKNLYILMCPVSSEYDYETKTENKAVSYIVLRPLEYYKKSVEKGVSTNTADKSSTTTYRTNNSKLFWQKPQD